MTNFKVISKTLTELLLLSNLKFIKIAAVVVGVGRNCDNKGPVGPKTGGSTNCSMNVSLTLINAYDLR